MKNNIEKALKRAISQLPHPAAQELWEQPISKMTEHDYITRQEVPKRQWSSSRTMAFLATAVCFFVIFAGGGTLHYQNQVIRTVVDIDINPSIELNLNRKDNVVSAAGLNREAEELLNAVDIKGKDANAAIELIMLEAKEQHYFSQNENAVLLSVSAKNDKNAALLESDLSQQVRIAVDRKETPVTVVSQQFDKDDKTLLDNSSKYNISQGKMALIEKLEGFELSYTREQLVSLSIEELLLLLQEKETELSDKVRVDSSTWISEKTNAPVIEETRPEATNETVVAEVQPETKPETKPALVETKPKPTERPAPKTETRAPQIPMPEVDDMDDDENENADTAPDIIYEDINSDDDDDNSSDDNDDNDSAGNDDNDSDGNDDNDSDGNNDSDRDDNNDDDSSDDDFND